MKGLTANLQHMAQGPTMPPAPANRHALMTTLPSGSLLCVGSTLCSDGSQSAPFLLVVAAPATTLQGIAHPADNLWTGPQPATLRPSDLPGPSHIVSPVVGSCDPASRVSTRSTASRSPQGYSDRALLCWNECRRLAGSVVASATTDPAARAFVLTDTCGSFWSEASALDSSWAGRQYTDDPQTTHVWPSAIDKGPGEVVILPRFLPLPIPVLLPPGVLGPVTLGAAGLSTALMALFPDYPRDWLDHPLVIEWLNAVASYPDAFVVPWYAGAWVQASTFPVPPNPATPAWAEPSVGDFFFHIFKNSAYQQHRDWILATSGTVVRQRFLTYEQRAWKDLFSADSYCGAVPVDRAHDLYFLRPPGTQRWDDILGLRFWTTPASVASSVQSFLRLNVPCLEKDTFEFVPLETEDEARERIEEDSAPARPPASDLAIRRLERARSAAAQLTTPGPGLTGGATGALGRFNSGQPPASAALPFGQRDQARAAGSTDGYGTQALSQAARVSQPSNYADLTAGSPPALDSQDWPSLSQQPRAATIARLTHLSSPQSSKGSSVRAPSGLSSAGASLQALSGGPPAARRRLDMQGAFVSTTRALDYQSNAVAAVPAASSSRLLLTPDQWSLYSEDASDPRRIPPSFLWFSSILLFENRDFQGQFVSTSRPFENPRPVTPDERLLPASLSRVFCRSFLAPPNAADVLRWLQQRVEDARDFSFASWRYEAMPLDPPLAGLRYLSAKTVESFRSGHWRCRPLRSEALPTEEDFSAFSLLCCLPGNASLPPRLPASGVSFEDGLGLLQSLVWLLAQPLVDLARENPAAPSADTSALSIAAIIQATPLLSSLQTLIRAAASSRHSPGSLGHIWDSDLPRSSLVCTAMILEDANALLDCFTCLTAVDVGSPFVVAQDSSSNEVILVSPHYQGRLPFGLAHERSNLVLQNALATWSQRIYNKYSYGQLGSFLRNYDLVPGVTRGLVSLAPPDSTLYGHLPPAVPAPPPPAAPAPEKPPGKPSPSGKRAVLPLLCWSPSLAASRTKPVIKDLLNQLAVKPRFPSSADGSAAADAKLICFRFTMAGCGCTNKRCRFAHVDGHQYPVEKKSALSGLQRALADPALQDKIVINPAAQHLFS